MNPALQYISQVQNGEAIVCKWVKLAVERHLRDLERQNDDDFEFYFDEKAAQKPIDFFQKAIKHAKGRWNSEPFNLLPWQAFPLWCVYGWKRKKDDKRKYRKAYVKIARKNGKTEWLSGIGNYGFIADGEKDPEVYWVATKKDQAKIGWQRQKTQIDRLISDSQLVAKRYRTLTHRIFEINGTGYTAYLGKDSDTEDGLSPYYALVDEYHAHKDDGMINVMESGMGSRGNPLTWIITTAGFNSYSPCAKFEKTCKQILDGQLKDDQIFALIFDLDEGDDWQDEKNWVKANPSLGVSLTIDYLRSQYKLAKTQGGSKEIDFKTKNLNVWTTVAETWLPVEKWRACAADFDLSDLAGRECYGGLDLAATRDTNALCLLFPPENEAELPRVVWFYWLPEDMAHELQDKKAIPLVDWSEQGFITLTPGDVVDYATISQDIIDLTAMFNIRSVAHDRAYAYNVVPTLSEHDINCRPMGQGFMSMSAPTLKMEELIAGERIQHNNNAVSEWQFTNVAIRRGSGDDMKIDKDKSHEKVDGMVAMVMAIAEWMDATISGDGSSIYEQRGVLTI